MTGEAMPTGRERPGEHWNARLIREEAEQRKIQQEGDFDCCTDRGYRPKGYPLHATPEALDRLAETIADMLDNALHLEACWISEDETRCVCIIGALRAALPRCGHVEMVGAKKLTRQCLSTVHPSESYKHVFGVV
jgi:hypothetical protein